MGVSVGEAEFSETVVGGFEDRASRVEINPVYHEWSRVTL